MFQSKRQNKFSMPSSVAAAGCFFYDNGLGYAFSSAKEAAASGALPCPYCCE